MIDDFEKLIQELTFNFSRSGGKGGQNVNKVETKVELVFNIAISTSLNGAQKDLLLKNLGNKLDKEGNLRIVSQTERSQLSNRKKAIERFVSLIQKSLKKKKKRIKTKIPNSVKTRMLESKRKHSEKKRERKKIEIE